ncbi:dehydrogenase/oxidoreductase-like protein [Leishmania mexicana MHOM/GT/2001/U1103]|uniref:Dehydrogenase/oxidoreductase-like protein n=1 Tax=Leishmania mexicana (strain MHOM/GT/2001/U1103) TaxID=929439 RepID=E9AJN5_LEIMU|nr:dehydrogenase/oxidoreductase-like protein [Leishmania mexicana MHOM/GT/2001/U1103]CBZ23134.1 dehydrogenase/oxidoreductase-like protein [Leishmania mexicana MHOM/GT/2001/U1103]
MCESLALELIPSNICVNVRCPGTCDTPMGERLMPLKHQQPRRTSARSCRSGAFSIRT